jgi:hypothetical protein
MRDEGVKITLKNYARAVRPDIAPRYTVLVRSAFEATAGDRRLRLWYKPGPRFRQRFAHAPEQLFGCERLAEVA